MRFRKNIFMPFAVLGDPNHKQSFEIIKTLIDSGAGALELGFAFSDPIADGPVIQRANKRALAGGITTSKAFHILEEVRNYSSIPISLMLSFNIMYQYGIEKFYKRCSELQIDAVLCPDIPLEESGELIDSARNHHINQVFIVSQTTNRERMMRLNNVCSGYFYLVSLLGTTGIRDNLDSDLQFLIKKTKDRTSLPVYVGFGISNPEHVRNVIRYGADGAICGSAICRLIESNLDDFVKMKDEISRFSNKMK
ncbi:MAG: tryptophan synthase subunit alpha, partial [Nanoarchaeota archaeon]|nr:tryptophan synthase subunit alpha [Nanoarchaeota archaeon]